jgi:phage tail-like protein
MPYDVWYSIRNNRIKQGCIMGFNPEDGNTLRFDETVRDHYLFFRAIDGVAEDSYWGRFTCNLTMSEEMVCYIHVLASNEPPTENNEYLCDPEVPYYEKMAFFDHKGAKRFVNTDDFLLYDLRGRYLYVALEMIGSGSAYVGNIRIGARGDNFMGSFPEVYKERNGFLHRYLSIFSSIYNDISEQNEKLYEMLDLDKCSPDLLETYGSWFGLNLGGGSLPEEVLRNVVKEAYQLNRMKGTRWALERILTIMLEDDFVLFENRHKGGEIFEITVMIKRKLTEQLRHQLTFLLDQFRPLRVKIRLLQMEKDAVMDGNSYLDMNATIPSEKHLVLDEEAIYDGVITLV